MHMPVPRLAMIGPGALAIDRARGERSIALATRADVYRSISISIDRSIAIDWRAIAIDRDIDRARARAREL